jgi:hypothetical protein
LINASVIPVIRLRRMKLQRKNWRENDLFSMPWYDQKRINLQIQRGTGNPVQFPSRMF